MEGVDLLTRRRDEGDVNRTARLALADDEVRELRASSRSQSGGISSVARTVL